MELKVRLAIQIEPDEGRYHAYCLALKGLHVDGDTEEEALRNAVDGAAAYLIALIKRGEPLPVGCDFDHGRPTLKELIRNTFLMHRPTEVITEVRCAT